MIKRRGPLLLTIAVFGYAFLYIPILSVVVYSFNDSRLVTLWGGFSLRWYASLLDNDAVISAALLSLQIAIATATIATVLGTLVGLGLARLGNFRGRLLLTGMITSPLVMPEIITGISLLFLFITLTDWSGWPGQRGPVASGFWELDGERQGFRRRAPTPGEHDGERGIFPLADISSKA